MIIGAPAKACVNSTPEQIEGLRQSALHYIENARRFKRACAKIGLRFAILFFWMSELHKFCLKVCPCAA